MVSLGRLFEYQVEARSLREGTEVAVSRQKCNATVNTRLRNQRIPEPGLAPFG